jgi:hypothetical protein
VNVTVALSTLLGYDEQAGEIDGGPVPNDLLLRIAPWGSPRLRGRVWRLEAAGHRRPGPADRPRPHHLPATG